MQQTENYVIDLSNCKDSNELINNVIQALDIQFDKNVPVKLKLDEIQINESQMTSIQSLIKGYGTELGFVETNLTETGDICHKMGIQTNNSGTLTDVSNSIQEEFQNVELEDLRKEFQTGLQDVQKEENVEEKDSRGHVELIKEENETSMEPKRQTIGVYRKADEKENAIEFGDEDVDFYATPTDEPVVVDTKNTIYVNQTLRSGQILEYDGNVVIIGDCHPGSEIRATGDITVWGVLGSIAHAGCKGQEDARIRALKMNAIQLRIANCYSRRPDTGNIPYIIKSSTFTPEEARISDGSIVLYKMASD